MSGGRQGLVGSFSHLRELLYHGAMVRGKSAGEKPLIIEVDAMTAAAHLFHSFSDPSRLVILQHLQLGEHRVIDLTEHLGLSQSTVSKHLACLKESGLVTSRPEGRSSMYTLNHSDQLVALLSAAETLLALTSDAVTLCPLHSDEVAHA